MTTYRPEKAVTGPSYGPGFKGVATVLTVTLLAYGASIAWRFPLLSFGIGVKLLLASSVIATGIRQTWLYDKQVTWSDIRGCKMLGIPYMSWLFPPRMVVRTGNSFTTFNGGSQDVLIEFAKISLAYQLKR